MNYENRKFIIFNVTELNLVDFSQVLETSIDTVRKSVNKTKCFVKWEGETPTFVNNITTKTGPYTYDEIMVILKTAEWLNPDPLNLTLNG
jgi:hypothetical protein